MKLWTWAVLAACFALIARVAAAAFAHVLRF